MGEESRDDPLLLNPVQEDPSEHLDVDLETGLLIDKTDRGRTCIDIFGLNIRQALVTERRKHIQQIRIYLAMLPHCREDSDLARRT